MDLLDLLCMAATATSAYRIPNAVKLRKVEVWAPMASDLAPVTCSVEWRQPAVAGQGVGGNSQIRSDTSMGSARPAYVSAKPPPGSLASMWLNGGNPFTVLAISGPANTVVDVHLSFRVGDSTSEAQAVGAAVAGATVGTVYVRKLDSNNAALLPPVALATI